MGRTDAAWQPRDAPTIETYVKRHAESHFESEFFATAGGTT